MRIAGPENAIHCRQKLALGCGTGTLPCDSGKLRESGGGELAASVFNGN